MLDPTQIPEAALRELVERVLEVDDPEGSPSLPKGFVCRLLVQGIQAGEHIGRGLGDHWGTAVCRERAKHTLKLAILDLEKEADPISAC